METGGERPLKVVAIALAQASHAARRGQVAEVDAAGRASLVDVELQKLLRTKREAVLGGLSQRASRALGQLTSVESGQTVYDGAEVAVELAALASALRILDQAVAARAA
jgi:hypothetical protein